MEATMMTWEEIRQKYPDRWVALTNYKKQGPRIIEAIPVRVCKVPLVLWKGKCLIQRWNLTKKGLIFFGEGQQSLRERILYAKYRKDTPVSD